ncbi:MAG: pantetheine-phosphate adenylyltransferase [Planctomycetaceae bacterium]|nr:pantetheine-phosphate adenylyltransferase [Planctomycetaceae bacterium]
MTRRVAVYAGSFDPVTLGHEDMVRRGAQLFDRLIVGIGINPEKQPLFTAHERQELMQNIFADLPNVRIECFSGLTVEFTQQCKASIMLRGVRTVSDIEAEFTMALANRTLAPELETVFLMATDRYSHISSSLIKQVAQMGRGDIREHLKQFVPEAVIEPLMAKVK